MNKNNPREFFEGVEGDRRTIPSLAPSAPNNNNPSTAAILASAATGAAAYLAAPDALGVPRGGQLDELAAAAIAACTYFASRLVAPHLCSTKKEQRQVEKWNIVKGAGAGATVGVPIAIKIAADVAVTGGLLTALAVAGAGSIWIYNRLNKVKYCRHCQTKDSCDHVVCRNPRCLKLHFPMENPLRCDESISLTWYALASQLHNDGLNYFEALDLVGKHFNEWVPHIDGRGRASAIECRNFAIWRDKNMPIIAAFRETVDKPAMEDLERLRELEAELKRGRT